MKTVKPSDLEMQILSVLWDRGASTAREMLEKRPEFVIRECVRRMLPKSKLGAGMLKKLKVYAGTDHPHTYQKPEELQV